MQCGVKCAAEHDRLLPGRTARDATWELLRDQTGVVIVLGSIPADGIPVRPNSDRSDRPPAKDRGRRLYGLQRFGVTHRVRGAQRTVAVDKRVDSPAQRSDIE